MITVSPASARTAIRPITPGCAPEYPGVASGTIHKKRVVLL
jgi:hypothetical protein